MITEKTDDKKQWEGIGQTPAKDYDQAHAALCKVLLAT